MKPPTIVLPPHNPTAVRTAKAKRHVLIQCEQCGCSGSGAINGHDQVASVNLPATLYRGVWRHSCGGDLAGFDIEAGQ